MVDFWNNIPPADELRGEGNVELRLIIPLLRALGYEDHDIDCKYPVIFQQGRLGRKPEADVVCFYGPLRNRDTSLLVVEAKKPGEALNDGKAQGESYAENLRAPLLLLTNGETLEIWQLQTTRESSCVLATSVASLARERGRVERFLGKMAVFDYCQRFNVKTILEASGDYSRYETAELRRSSTYEASISRTLRRMADTGQTTSIETDRLLAEFQSGAVIVAPSGYGKTTLSHRLFRQAVEERWRGKRELLAVDVPLPDLEQTGVSILEFMHQRLSAHCPGVTPAFLAATLRDVGATILCDGFDRSTGRFRAKLVAEFANLVRDYPRAQLFIFSRAALKPSISLPLLNLQPLSVTQKREFEQMALGGTGSLIYMMSRSLRTLCDHPLLLRLTLEYWRQHGEFPRKIEALFRSWLDRLLETEPNDYVSAAQRERALTALSQATANSPIGASEAISIMTRSSIPSTTLNELIGCDAVRVDGSSIEVQHEALADYLRAKAVSVMEEEELLSFLPRLTISADSFFPVLLVAQLRTHRLQSILWRRLSELDLSIYFDALRYRFDVSSELERLDPKKLSERYLQTLLDGFEEPLMGFFPHLRKSVLSYVIGDRDGMLAVTGQAHTHPGALSYKLHARGPGEARVNIAMPSFPGTICGVDLDLSRYRIDSARLLGMTLLKETVLDAAKGQQISGGPLWAAERIIGRVRYLAKQFGANLTVGDSFAVLEAHLNPQAKAWVEYNAFFGGERFSVQSLLDDIATLRAAGQDALDPWWLHLGWDEGATLQDEEVIRRVLDEDYRRRQWVYAEVVRASFPGLLDQIGWFTALPIRWKLIVARRDQMMGGSTVYPRWRPVESWDEAGADVSFIDSDAPIPDDPEETRKALAKLNRQNDKIRRIGGFTSLSSYDGYQWNGHFDGATPVMHEVCDMLIEELRDLFDALPGSDGAF